MSYFKTFFTSLKLFILLSTSIALAENPKNIIAANVNEHIITAQDVLDAYGRLPSKLKEVYNQYLSILEDYFFQIPSFINGC